MIEIISMKYYVCSFNWIINSSSFIWQFSSFKNLLRRWTLYFLTKQQPVKDDLVLYKGLPSFLLSLFPSFLLFFCLSLFWIMSLFERDIRLIGVTWPSQNEYSLFTSILYGFLYECIKSFEWGTFFTSLFLPSC